MNNLKNYIKENKDKSFKELKFNEIDALIFSLISYIDFSGIVNSKITIGEAIKEMDKTLLSRIKDRFFFKNEEMFKLLAETQRYQNVLLENYVKVDSKITQFAAITIRVPHEFIFVSFEGTDDQLIGWEEDFKMSYEFPVPAQKLAIQYLNNNIKLKDFVVYVGGHSKGGNLAIAALINSSLKTRLLVKKIFNFDGPGFLKDQISTINYKRIVKKIYSYYPEKSIIGMVLENKGKEIVVKSNAINIFQHDAHTWAIQDYNFERGKLSEYSKNMRKRFEKIMNNYSFEKRKLFVSTFFNLLYNSGYKYKSDLKKISFSNLKAIIQETKNLKDEEKKLILDIFKGLLIG